MVLVTLPVAKVEGGGSGTRTCCSSTAPQNGGITGLLPSHVFAASASPRLTKSATTVKNAPSQKEYAECVAERRTTSRTSDGQPSRLFVTEFTADAVWHESRRPPGIVPLVDFVNMYR